MLTRRRVFGTRERVFDTRGRVFDTRERVFAPRGQVFDTYRRVSELNAALSHCQNIQFLAPTRPKHIYDRFHKRLLLLWFAGFGKRDGSGGDRLLDGFAVWAIALHSPSFLLGSILVSTTMIDSA